MSDLAQKFKIPIGLSDHTMGTTAAIAAVALGACVIEKHVTLSRAAEGVDGSFSLEPDELQSLCQQTKASWQALGVVSYKQQPAEQENIRFRRSIYVVENIKQGEQLTAKNIRIIRPGYGLKPKYLPEVMGKYAEKDLHRGHALSFADVQAHV